MGLASALNQLDKRYAWSLLGFVLAIVFGGLTIYTEFLRDKRPQLKVELVSDASVLDVRENLTNLAILYDGTDIRAAKQSLRVIVVRIQNEGPDDILKSHYDDRAPLGFEVVHGTLLRAEIISTTNDYLQNALRNPVHKGNTVSFPPVILEAGESFTTKSLILHTEGTRPQILPMGKIAGLRRLNHVDSTQTATELGALAQALAGTPVVQLIRLALYTMLFLVAAAVILLPMALIGDMLGARKRRRNVVDFKAMTSTELQSRDHFIFASYIEAGSGALFQMAYVIERIKIGQARADALPLTPERAFRRLPRRMRHEMLVAGLITRTADGSWDVNKHSAQVLEEFTRFVGRRAPRSETRSQTVTLDS